MKKIFTKIRLQQKSKGIRIASVSIACGMMLASFMSDARMSPLINTRSGASFYLETAVDNSSTEIEDVVDSLINETEHDMSPVSTSTTVMGSMFTNSSVMTSTTTTNSTTSSYVETATTNITTTLPISTIDTTSSSSTTTSTTITVLTTTNIPTTKIKTEESSTTTTTATTVIVDNSVYYKPGTHYLHKKSCRWFDNTCEKIESTEGLECRKCTECNPEMEIITPYTVPTKPSTQTVSSSNGYASLNKITDVERIYLCNVVGSEYGADWVPLAEKALVVSTVMNRYYNGGWTNGAPNTIYNVLTAPYQYDPSYAVPYYRYNVTQSCIDAVEYYFENEGYYRSLGYTSYWGDGRQNHFR